MLLASPDGRGAGAARPSVVARDAALARRGDRGHLAIAGAFGFTAWMLSDEVAAFSRRLPGIVREIRLAVQSASPRQSLIQQLQQAVTELEKTATAGEADRCHARHDRRTVDVQRQMMNGARSAAGYSRDRDPADVPGLFPAGARARCSRRSSSS